MGKLIQELKELYIDECKLELTVDQIDNDTPLFGGESPFGTDSLDAIGFSIAIQEKYNIEFPEGDPQVNTIQEIAKEIESRQSCDAK